MNAHRFPYEWKLADATFTKDKGSVFSCFACGGGSTMGYKLAGFDVLGCNEIDPKMMTAYKTNHHPRFAFEESITTFKLRDDLPEELYSLDILDGSPPCSSFSMAGNREQDWGKEKVFSEGQAKQVLDTLFFDYIDLGKRLRPKVIIAENVLGLLLGNARDYVTRIHAAFAAAGYCSQHLVLDASKMGIPQKRSRVFFIAVRIDLLKVFTDFTGLFDLAPTIKIAQNGAPIPFSEIRTKPYTVQKRDALFPSEALRWKLRQFGDRNLAACDQRYRGKGSFFNQLFLYDHEVVPTITATAVGKPILFDEERKINTRELCLAGSYPLDYDFCTLDPGYLIGMSVPPVMTANIATAVHEQWLIKINAGENK